MSGGKRENHITLTWTALLFIEMRK